MYYAELLDRDTDVHLLTERATAFWYGVSAASAKMAKSVVNVLANKVRRCGNRPLPRSSCVVSASYHEADTTVF